MSEPSPAFPEPPGRDRLSTDARIISVFGVVLGTLGLSCLPFNFGVWVIHSWPFQPVNSGGGPSDVWVLASTFIGLFLAMLLLVSSLAAGRFLMWGRNGMLIWAVLSLLYGAVGIFFWGKFFFPQLAWQYIRMRGPDELGGLLAWMIGSIFAILTFWNLTRPAVRAAFLDAQRPASHEPQ